VAALSHCWIFVWAALRATLQLVPSNNPSRKQYFLYLAAAFLGRGKEYQSKQWQYCGLSNANLTNGWRRMLFHRLQFGISSKAVGAESNSSRQSFVGIRVLIALNVRLHSMDCSTAVFNACFMVLLSSSDLMVLLSSSDLSQCTRTLQDAQCARGIFFLYKPKGVFLRVG